MGARVVWKYPFPELETRIEPLLPTSSRVVHFAPQGNALAAWIERPVEDDDEALERRTLLIVGTGQELPPGAWEHRGTAIVAGGRYVFHLYEEAHDADLRR